MVDLSFIQCNQPLNKVLKSRESLVYKAKWRIWSPPYCACARRFRTTRCKNSANRCKMSSIESPGRKAVVQCTSDVTSLLKHNLSCSGKLLEKGLITKDVHDFVLTATAVSNNDKASRLVSCLADRVKSTQLFHDLIKTLKEADPFCGDIVDKLTEAFQRGTSAS